MSCRNEWFEIGVYRPKTTFNVGTLWRSAWQLNAAGIFLIGPRFLDQPSNTTKTQQKIPTRVYPDFEGFLAARPYDAQIIGVEMGGEPLSRFVHPARAVYLLGAEDDGLPPQVKAKCQRIVSIEACRSESFNVAVAGSIVMWHRFTQHRADLVRPLGRLVTAEAVR